MRTPFALKTAKAVDGRQAGGREKATEEKEWFATTIFTTEIRCEEK